MRASIYVLIGTIMFPKKCEWSGIRTRGLMGHSDSKPRIFRVFFRFVDYFYPKTNATSFISLWDFEANCRLPSAKEINFGKSVFFSLPFSWNVSRPLSRPVSVLFIFLWSPADLENGANYPFYSCIKKIMLPNKSCTCF